MNWPRPARVALSATSGPATFLYNARGALRVTFRMVMLATWAPVGIAIALTPLLLPHAMRKAAVPLAVRVTLRGALFALGVRVVTRGALPTGGSLVVANHLSWLDIAVFAMTWRCTFVAKREVGTWPVVGALARALGVVFVHRERKRDLLTALPRLEQALDRGECVVLFPEGTTTDGRYVLPFKSALFEAAVRAAVPVTPVALGFTTTEGDASRLCWIESQSLLSHVPEIAALRGATVHVCVERATLVDRQRKPLAREARNRVVVMRNGYL